MDPWSKGDYSRHIWEPLMVVEKLPEINPSSGRVLGRRLLALPILKRGGGGTEARSQKRVPSSDEPRHGEYIGEGVHPWGH